MKLTLNHPKLISLAAGFTDNESLPVAEARDILDEVLGTARTARPALQYGSTQGDPLLRKLTAEHLQKAKSNFSKPPCATMSSMCRESFATTRIRLDPGPTAKCD